MYYYLPTRQNLSYINLNVSYLTTPVKTCYYSQYVMKMHQQHVKQG